MAKARKKRNSLRIKALQKPPVPKPANDEDGKLKPTPERERHNLFRNTGATSRTAMRVVPVIVRLHERGVLNDREFEALAYYRDQASLADKSPVRSSCDFSVRGGSGPGVAIVSAAIETGRMERNMGPLWSLCRSVAVDDVTLERWAMWEWGSVKGSDPPAPCPEKVSMAALELKYAAGGIVVGRAA